MPIPAIPVGAAILGGSAITGLFNAKQASKNRGFQRNMSNTSYQRGADDMEKAGLNRILALGGGASTPGGSTATAPDMGASAKEALMIQKGLDKIDAETNLISEQGRLTGYEADKAKITKMLYTKYGPQADGILDKLGDFGAQGLNSAKSLWNKWGDEADKREKGIPTYDKKMGDIKNLPTEWQVKGNQK